VAKKKTKTFASPHARYKAVDFSRLRRKTSKKREREREREARNILLYRSKKKKYAQLACLAKPVKVVSCVYVV